MDWHEEATAVDFDREPEWVVVADAVAVRGTKLALRVQIPSSGKTRETWLPRSVIAACSGVKEVCDEGKLIVAFWWAEKELLDWEYEEIEDA